MHVLRRLFFVLAAPLFAVLPSGALDLPAKSVRVGPLDEYLSTANELVSLAKPPGNARAFDVLDLTFRYFPTKADHGTVLKLSDSFVWPMSIEIFEGGDLVLVAGRDPVSQRATVLYPAISKLSHLREFQIRVQIRPRKQFLRLWINGRDVKWLKNHSTQEYIATKEITVREPDVQVGGQNSADGVIRNLQFSIGSSTLSLPSDLIRGVLILFCLVLVSVELTGRQRSTSEILMRFGLVISLVGVGLTLSRTYGSSIQHRTSTSAFAALMSSNESKAVSRIAYRVDFELESKPISGFTFIRSFGIDQGQGFHLTLDSFGNIFLALGRVGEIRDDYALLLLSGPSPGRHSLKMDMGLEDGRTSQLGVMFDNVPVPLNNAVPNSAFALSQISVVPFRFVAERTAEFESNFGRVTREEIEVSVREREVLPLFLFFDLIFLALTAIFCGGVRRFKMENAFDEGRPTANFAEGHANVFSKDSETKK